MISCMPSEEPYSLIWKFSPSTFGGQNLSFPFQDGLKHYLNLHSKGQTEKQIGAPYIPHKKPKDKIDLFAVKSKKANKTYLSVVF